MQKIIGAVYMKKTKKLSHALGSYINQSKDTQEKIYNTENDQEN